MPVTASGMDKVCFFINGIEYSAGCELPSYTTLNEFIRRHAELRGTKYMCLEGGCGTCVVNVKATHPNTHERVSFSVNSCLVVIFSCDGWEITTVEGIGNRKIGYNIIQKRLNQNFGSQCGYCSPGFVMSMYSLAENNPHLSAAEVENSLGSNLCRCTGYRPILDAFKSIALKDIEELDELTCPKTGRTCTKTCESEDEDWCLVNIQGLSLTKPKKIALADGRLWFEVYELKSVFDILDKVGYESYMLVGGNTARGVRPIKSFPLVLFNISNLHELHSHYMDVNLVLGASITLTDTINLFQDISTRDPNFRYLEVLRAHIERVAHIPVRNIGTLAGNLVLKHEYPDFQSDIFLLLDGVGATVTLVDRTLTRTELNMTAFLNTNIVGKVITQIKLPPFSNHYELVTYKVTPREQNAHADINAAFLFQFGSDRRNIIQARIVYGGIRPTFSHAYVAEAFLKNKNIFNNETLQAALHHLDIEIQPVYDPPQPSPLYRKKVALSLFYKAIIKLCPPEILKPCYASGASSVTDDRPPISSGYQEYDTDVNDYPLTQPLLKREGMIQCAGEAVYSDDIPAIKDEVFAAFVLSTVPKADIQSIDATEALKVKGVITVLTAADIPGMNSFVFPNDALLPEFEVLLASKKVQYYNQPVALVVANTMALADQVKSLIKINYSNIWDKPIVFTIEQALEAPKEENRVKPRQSISPTSRGTNVQKIVKGTFISPRQYHFMMELHTTVTIPVDNGFEIQSATQYTTQLQSAVARVLNVPESFIIVKTRRCGGAFGSKYIRSNMAACASALVAKILNRPCRVVMHLYDIMRATGKRPNSRLDYEVGVDDNGVIQYLDAAWYINDGLSLNENECDFVVGNFPNCYDLTRWKVQTYSVVTDAPTNCFMRAPGSIEAIAGIEHIMDHISMKVNKDPVLVRISNYSPETSLPPLMVTDFLQRIDFSKREADVIVFNAHHRWKKRGINFVNMAFSVEFPSNFIVVVNVYFGDGSVILSIGGIEIGQGLYTRMAQVAARELNVHVERVTIAPSFNFATPNTFGTVASVTTECCARSVIDACNQIKARLAPVRADMPNATWEQIVFAANDRGILLQANSLTGPYTPGVRPYKVYGLAAIEVELDILTGRKWIVRADVYEDCGRSINPALDVGQVEGAFIQALSLWTLEDTVYNEYNGKLYNYRTWNYKIYGAKDIPNDYRIYLRRRSVNPDGVLGSKAVSEPPSCMAYVIVNAIRDAIRASRLDSGYRADEFIPIGVPVTNENVVRAADVRIDEYLLY
ncbi:xanthine dehydrogenase-like [Epargyreus clarus]|uniref:xanthine dehydrogenase-like n=1 Tax=Epargyreus clarus TaxID=520877 RepID=UPI003C2C572A